jgi:small subunit ribosomal protein S2
MITLQELIDSGVHFGHRISRWNPKMKPFIYGKRSLIHIIDLKETVRGIIRATNFLKNEVAEGQIVLFVGTKRQARKLVEDEAKRCQMPFVSERWLGGTLTNYATIRERLERLNQLEKIEAEGRLSLYTKKEIAQFQREKSRIQRNLQGIRIMTRLPGAVIVVDSRREINAVREAKKLGIPTICILDTDCDPDLADIPIPGNDDAFRSVKVLLTQLTEAVMEGRKAYMDKVNVEEKRREEDSRIREKEKRDREQAFRVAADARRQEKPAAPEAVEPAVEKTTGETPQPSEGVAQ